MKRYLAGACVAFLGAAIVPAVVRSQPRHAQYAVTILDMPGSGGCIAWDVNASGTVVGACAASPGSGQVRAFVYDGQMQYLFPSEVNGSSEARSINDTGDIVGWATSEAGSEPQPFLYRAGVKYGLPGASFVIDINNQGQIAGYTNTGGGRAIAYTDAGVVDLPVPGFGMANAINNFGRVAGAYFVDAFTSHGFVTSLDGDFHDLGAPNGGSSSAIGINDVGWMVGDASNAHAWLYKDGAFVDLDPSSRYFSSSAIAINNSGQIVGQFVPTMDEINRAFIVEGTSIRDLNELMPRRSPWLLYAAYAINEAGQIVGGATDTATQRLGRGFLLTPIDGCSFSITPDDADVQASGDTGVVRVTTRPGCSWTAHSNTSWIQVTSFGGSGSGSVEYTVSPAPSSAPRTGTLTIAGQQFSIKQHGPFLTVWLNAFIPKTIPHVTRPLPGGSGETMIPGPLDFLPNPLMNECFLTDERGSSDDPNASSRMHSQVTIDLTAVSKASADVHRIDPTIAVDCRSGAELGRLQAETTGMQFGNVVGDRTSATIQLTGAAGNPFFTPLSPPIQYQFEIEIRQAEQRIDVFATGRTTFFPAFEMYAALGDGDVRTVKPLFVNPPTAGTTFFDLTFGLQVDVPGGAHFRLR